MVVVEVRPRRASRVGGESAGARQHQSRASFFARSSPTPSQQTEAADHHETLLFKAHVSIQDLLDGV
jgi:hypothetical protein